MTSPICPACYGDTSELPIEGLKYYTCGRCKHIFSELHKKKAQKIVKRSIFRSIDNHTGLFDPFTHFNGSTDVINRLLYGLNKDGGIMVSNFNHEVNNFTSKQCVINAEDDIFKAILNSHKEKAQGHFLSFCFMPFFDNINEFLTVCYNGKGKDGQLIVLTNIDESFLKNNIGQVHHFTSESLHYILSSQQKDYRVFTVNGILGFKIY